MGISHLLFSKEKQELLVNENKRNNFIGPGAENRSVSEMPKHIWSHKWVTQQSMEILDTEHRTKE